MKADRIFWGLILILFGILFMLKNMGYIAFQFSSIWKWWPLLLVYWGFSALLKDKSGKTSPALYGVQIIILAILVYAVIRPKAAASTDGRSYKFEYNDDDNQVDEDRSYQFEVPMERGLESALLNLEFSAGELNLKNGKTNRLIGADAVTNFGNYSFENSIRNGRATIEMGYSSNKIEYDEGDFSNKLDIDLNPAVMWDIMFETGASKADLDLSELKIRNIEVEGGASRFKLKLGPPEGQMNVAIETGASSVSILIPKNARCELITEDGFSTKTINGLQKIENGLYRSSDFEQSTDTNTITIRLESGLSKIDVDTY